MKIKHKILEELYQVQIVEKKSPITMEEVSMNLDKLRSKVPGKEKAFQAALNLLDTNKEIFVDWSANTATVLSDGISSYAVNKYYNEYIRLRRETIDFRLKVIGSIGIITVTLKALIDLYFFLLQC